MWTQQPSLATAFDGWGNPIRYVHPVFKGLLTTVGDPTQPIDLAAANSIYPTPPGKQWGIHNIRRNNKALSPPPPTPMPGDLADSDGGEGAVEAAAAATAAASTPISDVRGSAEYRRAMAAVIASRAITAALTRARGGTVPIPASPALHGAS